jgi:cell division protease FtsH
MDENQPPQQPQGFDWRRYRGLIFWMILMSVLIILLVSANPQTSGRTEELDYSELLPKIRQGEVERVVVETASYDIRGTYRDKGDPASTDQGQQAPTGFVAFTDRPGGEKLSNVIDDYNQKHDPDVGFRYEQPNVFFQILRYFIPWLILFVVIYFLFFRQLRGMGGGGVLSFGKSRATRITREKAKKTFSDVAGAQEAKDEVYEIIEFLRDPERFRTLGGRLPRGCLLIGSPGTGKTLLAKAIAGEADVPFYSISGSDFVEMFVGVGASRVRDLFEQAKENAPCIIFLDEIDAVGRKRGTGFSGGHDEREQTLNAILVEMDGFATDENVIVMAATNRPDVLDPALLRPGRFDRRIYVDLPDLKGREEILKVHSRSITLAESVNLQRIARGTPGLSGADLENIMNEGALLAAMRHKRAVDLGDLEEARDKVLWGKEKRSRVMTEEDRRLTAWHESGHAMVNALLEHVSPLHKVTIIARGRALGATMQLPEKDEYNISRRRVLGDIQLLLAGRIAEELFCDDITSGAANDLERATDLARAMVCEWGMSESLGLVRYPGNNQRGNQGWGDMSMPEHVAEATAERIDAEVRRIVDSCYDDAKRLLEKHQDAMRNIVDALLEFEVVDAEEVKKIIDGTSVEELRAQRQAAKEGPIAELGAELENAPPEAQPTNAQESSSMPTDAEEPPPSPAESPADDQGQGDDDRHL